MRHFLLMLVCCAPWLLPAQSPEKRIALVIGNARYAANPLTNPPNDARDVAETLRRAGFSVTEKHDLNYVDFNNAITDFTRQFSDPNIVALIFYAGHGIQAEGENYLVPVDADNLADDELLFRCVGLAGIASKMASANNHMNIVILDACRSYPVQRRGRNVLSGLAQFNEQVPESLVAYATAPGQIALDQNNKPNSLFTENLLKYIVQPGMEISEVFFEVRRSVKEQSDGKQIPTLDNRLTRKFYFFKAPGRAPATITQPAALPHMESKPPKNPETWEHCVGISYSRFGQESDGTYLKTAHFNAYQAYYMMVKRAGGFVSLGVYSCSYDLAQSSGYQYSRAMATIGPGIRFWGKSPGFRLYGFAGVALFMNNPDGEVFGKKVSDVGFEFLVVGAVGQMGFKVGYLSAFEEAKGFAVGMHYCF